MRLRTRIGLTLFATTAAAALFYLLILRPEMDSLALSVMGERIELLAPRWLGLLLVIPALLFIRSFSLVDMSRTQQALSAMVRSLLIVVVALALARPTILSEEGLTSTVFVVDVSKSVDDAAIEKAHAVVNDAWKQRGKNDVRIITFATRPEVLKLAPTQPSVPPLKRHLGARSGQESDIQAALQHAYGLFPKSRIPRIVLLSDGNETRGDVLAEAYRASGKKVRIHVTPYGVRQQKEVLVKALELPKDVRMGAPFHLRAEVYSTHGQAATLTLYKDEFLNGLDARKKVTLQAGRNVFKFKSLVREAGFVNYRLVLSGVKSDTWRNNNTAAAILPVLGRPKVLLVEGEPLYAGYLKRALEAERIDVTVRGQYGVPSSVAQLAKYDLLIVSDVPATYVGLSQMAAIHAYVRDLGGGFLMAGGQNSFGAGGYYGTRIEKILPVRFDTEKKRSQPSLALALCIDRSGSMSGQKIELAKDAAKATAELLGGQDLLGVIAFDSSAHVLVRLQRASNRLRILNDIARLRSGGGTNIRPCLQEAYNQLQTANAKIKHVILLSDGQSSYNGIPELVDEMVGRRITVSAVGVGSGADRTLLQMIAERGNGRFYHTNDANNIPKIFTKETTKVARSAVVEELIKVRVAKRANVIDGINMGAAPFLRGYVSTKAKRLAETILVSDLGEPIYAQWRVGLGKTAAFTSDVKNRWAVEWLRWKDFSKFWAQVVREVMRHRVQRSFELRSSIRHGKVKVTVDALDRSDHFINGLDSELTVLDPKRPGAKQRFPLFQVAAGRYATEFRLTRYGAFILRAQHKVDGKVLAESISSLSMPYPKEFTDLVPDRAKLERVAMVTKGKVDASPKAMLSADGETVRYHKDLWSLLVYVALGLLLLDIFLRRVRIFGWGPPTSPS
ncbi:MAG: VWA domain-containing protein [Deltaproteobacteria bacterium]|nr:VWA domain-containing protein [Deltaproteobacteria bacterium]